MSSALQLPALLNNYLKKTIDKRIEIKKINLELLKLIILFLLLTVILICCNFLPFI
jgi:hypothetical protein